MFSPMSLVFGVLRESVLGPALFTSTHNPCPRLYPVMTVIITSMLMTQKSLTVHHLAISLLLSPTFKPA